MKKIYYLFSIAFVFMSLHVGLAQTGCSDLEITAVEDGSVCGGGSVTLQATGSGTGDEIIWYDAATGGDVVGNGSVFQSPFLSSTASFWASEILLDGAIINGETEADFTTGTSNSLSAVNSVITFAVENTNSGQITITDIENYLPANTTREHGLWYHPTNISGDPGEISTANGWIQATQPQVAISGSSLGIYPVFEDISVTIPGNTTYRFALQFTDNISGASTFYYWGSTATPAAPNSFSDEGVNLLVGDHTAGGSGVVGYGGAITGPINVPRAFYGKIKFEALDVLCESPREEVIATVNNNADEDIASLPYTHTENTATYFNNYSGAPGSDCGTTDNFLDGNDVVYKYTADDDYILSVELTDLDEINTAIFVYEDCADIGDTCAVEGSINDENTADHGFQMLVEDGKDYYFVISSAEPTDSFNYTLKVDGNTCATYPAPTGGASQDFVDGQKLFDLDVTGINLTWYSDSALTNEIDEDTEMVDNTTYYVTQTFDTCESSALAITANELSCSILDVVATEDGEVCGEGTVWLSANGAEALANTNIYWFDSATGGSIVGKGNDFQTEALEQTTSFWATEVALSGGGTETGLGKSIADAGNAGYAPTSSGYGLQFTANEAFTLASVTVLSSGSGGDVNIVLKENDHAGQIIDSKTVAVVGGGSTSNPIPDELILEFEIPGPGTYYIYADDGPNMIRDSSGSSFPYSLGAYGEITTGYSVSSSASAYYFFYDWTIGSEEIICESDRVEVIAEVNEVADEIVNEPLPYSHTANTRDYGNNYFGEPGTDCIAEPYLDGNDVVYQFTPSIGAVYSIELSGLSSNNAGVFVYESCYDIGVSCIAGAVGNGTTADFGIDEVALNDGQDYFIVISTKTSSSTDYTITIDEAQIDCADYQDAPIGDEEQIVNIGSTLDDLKVKGANLIWYSDSSLNTVLPGTTVIDDGETYYVTQTLNGCESDDLEIIVYELDCDALEVVAAQDATIVCKGAVTLTAQGTGIIGTDLFWYESETATEHVYKGTSFTIPEINTTTSYWVAEAAFEGGEITGQAKEEPSSTATTSLASYGLQFDVTEEFVLASVDVYPTTAGVMDLELRDASGTVLETIAGINVPAGDGQTPHTIQLDLTIPVGQGLRLIKTSTTPPMVRDSSGNTFPYPIGNFGEITGGALNQGSSTSYYWFYNWTLGSEEIICESPRVEVEVEVTPDPNEEITSLPYSHSENTGTYGNIYGGTPGDNCGITENYLNGSSAVYTYTATDDDLITIELTDLNEYYAGVFVYDSCSEIGEECLAGAVAGPSTDDIIIQDFPVEEGETYYIVVSSWLTNNIDYTLKVNSFSCSDLETPDGATTQQFVAGDTVDDLTAEATRVGAVLTWYEDAGLTQEITDPSTHDLVDGDSYYVTQTLNGCESDPLIITADEIDCSDLEIVDYTEATVACRGSVTLKAEASGTGSDIYWYESDTSEDILAIGETYTTPELTQTTSYWVSEVYTETGSADSNAPLPTYCTPDTGSSGCNLSDYIDDFILKDSSGNKLIEHLGTGCSTNAYGDYTNDASLSASLVAGGNYEFTVTHGTSSQYVRIWIDFDGNGSFEDADELVYESTSAGSTTVPTIGSFELPQDLISRNTVMRVRNTFSTGTADSCTQSSAYGEVHDYKITLIGAAVICESPRQEVVATIDQSGDIQLDYADLPYLDSNNTSNYGNNFSGDAGDGCDGANYLNGYEAMYYYEADPNNDDILTIELSNTNNPGAAVFIYDSCGEVGITCLNGASLENGVATIEDVYVEAGGQLLIVVSSLSGTLDYDLEIYGTDCNNIAAPTGEASPYFVAGDVIDDLEVDGSIYNQGFKWYKDAALTDEITDPASEAIVDGTSYFVTQTILDCESAAFEIIPMEFECGLMGVDPQVEDVYVCAPGGDITLKTTASGIGSEVFWYDGETDGNYLGKGTEMTFSVDQNTSFWATEVYLAGETFVEEQGKVEPSAYTTFASTLNYGLEFNVYEEFNLYSVDVYPDASGTLEISLLDSSGNLMDSVTESVNASVNNPVTVILDFLIPEGNGYRLLQTSSPSLALVRESTGNNFPYELGRSGDLGSITNGTYGTTTSNTTSYYYFYNWVIGEQDVICESIRTEYQVQLNDEVPNPPVVTPLQKICGDGLLSDILVLGENIQWYGSDGSKLNPTTPVIEGQRYYVTQTIKGCESEMQEVIMDFNDKSEEPVAAVNQAFETGETLQDLTVHGDNLRWYKDQFKTEELSEDTKLVDQTTYYVTQELEEYCESTPLGITVHEVLDVKDQLFEYFEFYPNPVEDILYITNSETIEQIEIFDVAGRKVIERKFNHADLKLNVEELSTGTYLLKAKVDGMEKVFRIIKK